MIFGENNVSHHIKMEVKKIELIESGDERAQIQRGVILDGKAS